MARTCETCKHWTSPFESIEDEPMCDSDGYWRIVDGYETCDRWEPKGDE